MNYTSKGARALQAATAKHRRPVDWATNGDAYALGAEALGLGELREKLKAVNREHARAGYLTPELSAKRQTLYDEMMNEARRLLTPEGFAAFYACF